MTAEIIRPADDDYLTREQLCERLLISRKTLWEWTRNGVAPPKLKVGGTVRFPKTALDEFLLNHVKAS